MISHIMRLIILRLPKLLLLMRHWLGSRLLIRIYICRISILMVLVWYFELVDSVGLDVADRRCYVWVVVSVVYQRVVHHSWVLLHDGLAIHFGLLKHRFLVGSTLRCRPVQQLLRWVLSDDDFLLSSIGSSSFFNIIILLNLECLLKSTHWWLIILVLHSLWLNFHAVVTWEELVLAHVHTGLNLVLISSQIWLRSMPVTFAVQKEKL